uniref:7TM_GPCR_Srx domain-containing protein n=1 Tax=Steinernema glaseri TaxID=37863 RepID=A0A1I8ATS4_9BILA
MVDFLNRLVLSVDAASASLVGAFLFFAPHLAGDFFFSRTCDGVHLHLIRCVGGQILASALVLHRFRNRAIETQTTCFVLRITACILGLLLLFHARSATPDLIQPTVLKTLIYSAIAGIVIYVVAIFRAGWTVGDTLHRENRVGNVLYQLDSIASICIGVAWLAVPQWLLHRQVRVEMDASHEFCGRVMGALFCASHIVSSHALHWKAAADRSLAIDARAVMDPDL